MSVTTTSTSFSYDDSGFDRAELEAAMSLSWRESLSSTPIYSSRVSVGLGGGRRLTRPGRRHMRCSRCGHLGHNRRTCFQRESVRTDGGRTRPMTGHEVPEESVTVPADEVEMTSQECPICLEGISKADASAKPCGHVFHSRCMDAWNRLNPTCAVCKN